ncbi:MAG: VTT domain-containing protein [Actinomycetota bacterium]
MNQAFRLPARTLARPGRNCWRIAQAERTAMVVDAEEYFRALAEALPKARRSILMVGWEFDSRTRLLRDGDEAANGLPSAIGPLLDRLARTRPGLDIRVLIWDSALIYAVNREFAGLVKMDWLTHRNLHFRLDDGHPIGASHHQKIVVLDDALAFVGGLDVTSQRWDSRAHLPADLRRSDPAFSAYPPFHDVMALVAGEAAAALGDICRDRWRCASGERLEPVRGGDWRALWPPSVAPLMDGADIAIARTEPAWDGGGDTHEVERLFLDMIRAARRLIFVENQYFASRRISAALERRLRAPDCPEIVVIGPGEPVSLLERSSMGVARARLYRRLLAADRHGRLRLYFPMVGGRDVKVHSKVMVVDDTFLRIGSANLNNRSLGLDTECDILVEAAGRPDIARAITAARHDLLAEHLGVAAETIARTEAELGGVHAAIAALGNPWRRLEPLDSVDPSPVMQIMADSDIPDPDRALETLVWVEEAMPGPARRPLQLRVLALYGVLALLGVAGVAWPLAPPEAAALVHPWLDRITAWGEGPRGPLVVIAAFLAAGLVRFPPSLLVLATAAGLGTWVGLALSLAGSVGSAALVYGLGRALGRGRVRRLAGWKVHRVNRALARRGVIGIMLLRLLPVAAFSVINLVAGAAGVRFRDFVTGTVLGMIPGLFAMSVLGHRLVAVLRRPDEVNIAVLAAATALTIAAGVALVNRLARAGGGSRRVQEA